jgi:hypothetical protein
MGLVVDLQFDGIVKICNSDDEYVKALVEKTSLGYFEANTVVCDWIVRV